MKKQFMDEQTVRRTLVRMAHQIVEKNPEQAELCIIGIRRRGVPIGKILAENIRAISAQRVLIGELDISLYRDDLAELDTQPTLNGTDIPFSVTGKTIILVDDVLYTGRTARAAMDAVIQLGRPACIQLAVLVDRGHRELPIRGDFVGKNIPTSRSERISVNVPEFDGVYSVELIKNEREKGASI